VRRYGSNYRQILKDREKSHAQIRHFCSRMGRSTIFLGEDEKTG
jgi:hypothetical protein